jgi:hypothetical protein
MHTCIKSARPVDMHDATTWLDYITDLGWHAGLSNNTKFSTASERQLAVFEPFFLGIISTIQFLIEIIQIKYFLVLKNDISPWHPFFIWIWSCLNWKISSWVSLFSHASLITSPLMKRVPYAVWGVMHLQSFCMYRQNWRSGGPTSVCS